MTKHSFNDGMTDDVLEVQGVEYPMNPIGVRAMRRLLNMQKMVANRAEDAPLGEEELDMAVEIVVSAVRPEVRDAFREHIEESVPPDMLIRIAGAIMGSFADVDPTQPESSSSGSTTTGSSSTDGAPAAALTPAN